MIDDVNDDTVLIFAIKSYDKLNYIKSEFTEDFKIFKYLKRLFIRYRTSGELKENLILNHIVTINNIFGVESGARLLFYKMDEKDYSALKTFLIYLNAMPDVVRGIRGKDIISSDISLDLKLADILRKL